MSITRTSNRLEVGALHSGLLLRRGLRRALRTISLVRYREKLLGSTGTGVYYRVVTETSTVTVVTGI